MKKRILVAPLNWGLGHATRCIPIIKYCLEEGHEVLIGGNGQSLDLLKDEYPELPFVEFPSLDISYNPFLGFQLSIIGQLPKMILYLKKEKRFTSETVKKYDLDFIISDNRYGVNSDSIPSAIITHQLNFKLGHLSSPTIKVVSTQVEKFNQCWIPDYSHRPLSGELSESKSKKIIPKFLGGLSRFNTLLSEERVQRDFLIVLSGPEPARTKFEKTIINVLKNSAFSYQIVRGTDNGSEEPLSKTIPFKNRLNSQEILEEIRNSKYIISRSGYSSILDLIALNKKAILIPTKGQVEQEYLAKYHNNKNNFICFDESKIDLELAVDYFQNNKTGSSISSNIDYKVIDEFLNSYI